MFIFETNCEVEIVDLGSTDFYYRKNTFTGVSIHASSLHPRVHKFDNINATIHWLISLPLVPDACLAETTTIN